MKSIKKLIRQNLRIRVVGFDDAPFKSRRNSPVKVAGVVCSGTRFEGMLWGEVRKDGDDATDVITALLLNSKFHEQVHMVLVDGLAFGGFNLIDLQELALRVDRPCVAVMRKRPDITAMKKALMHFDNYEERIGLIKKAGEIYTEDDLYFQVIGEKPEVTAKALKRVSDQGNVPEALRLAHLIGAAVITGQSSKRA
jgi:endonuclease V-like protein UPF0215 family